mmetsp:Transcript_59032/g.167863  ORF Transcript_59032/g.167863 Transcript_59032/m.167863 type:complete len:311 (-) Transcript_59032:221-1153(-)
MMERRGMQAASPMSVLPVTNIAEWKIFQYAENHLSKPSRSDGSALDNLEVTGMRSFNAVTKFSVQGDAFTSKLRQELHSADCPDKIVSAIVDNASFVDEEMSVKSDCRIEGSEGYWFKIVYCLHKEDGKTKFATTIFGASFKASLFERFETVEKPVLGEVQRSATKGMLWWKREETWLEKVQVGVEVQKTPVFKGITNKDLEACMELLEAKACEKVLETCSSLDGAQRTRSSLALQDGQEGDRPAAGGHSAAILSARVAASCGIAVLVGLAALLLRPGQRRGATNFYSFCQSFRGPVATAFHSPDIGSWP